MRTLLTALLAATALLPVQALAQEEVSEPGLSRRGEMRQIQARIAAGRAERGEAPRTEAPRPDRSDRPDRGSAGWAARPDRVPSPQLQPQFQPQLRPEPQRTAGQPRPDRGDTRYFRAAEDATRRDRDRDRAIGSARADRRDDAPRGGWDDRRDGRFDRGDRRDDRAGWGDRGGWGDRDGRGVGASGGWRNDGPRVDPRRYDPRGYDARSGWNRDWRGDRRYDWNDGRLRNRQAYRLPRYYAPGGWNGGYRRFSVGIRLSSLLFAQDYWIGDPGYYRLPPVYGPYRWVRYYNDALLIDIRYGTVVDTVYDIFW